MIADAIDGSSNSRKRPRPSSKRPDSAESSPKRATSEGPSLISESGKNPSRDEMTMSTHGGAFEDSIDNAVSRLKRKDPVTQGWHKHPPEEKLTMFSSQTEQPLKAGDSWFIVSMKWLNDWRMACKNEVSKEGAKEESTLGPVDNSPLLDEAGFFKMWLHDGTDYSLVPTTMWELFVEWYGTPPHTLERRVVAVGHSEQLFVECYIPRLKVYRLRSGSDAGIAGQGQPVNVEFSLRRSAKDFLAEICRIFDSKPDSTRIYRVEAADESDVGSEYPLALLRRLEHTLLGIDPNDPSTTLSDLQVNTVDHIVVEIRDGENWPSDSQPLKASATPPPSYATESSKQEYTFKSGGFFGEVSNRLGLTSPSRPVNGQTEASAILKPALNLIGKVKQASSSSKTPGLLGLGNLGNTCFMNSALQCLAHNEELTAYFLTELYRDELNRSNPLGMGGEIAEAYGALLARIWSTSGGSSYSPREFKQQLQRFAPQFSGYQQHDSQEFLAFLIDGLHEDLNRVLQKPYVTNPEWEGGGNKELVELARKSWEGYISRNDSAIVDLFQGQYKSTLVCPECQKVSITFDPFMYLTLPLPVKKKWNHDIYFIPWDLKKPHIKIPVEMDNDLSFKDLRRMIGRWTETDPEYLVTVEIFQHRFYKYLDDNTPLSDINPVDHVACYELPCNPRVNARNTSSTIGDHLVIPVHIASMKPRGYSAQPDLIGYPFLITLTPEEACSKEAIYSALVERTQRWTKNAQSLYKYDGGQRPSDTYVVPFPRDSEPPVSLAEIREDGEVVITAEADEVDISEVKTLDEDLSVDMAEDTPTPLGPQLDLFEMDLYHYNSTRLSFEATYNMKKISWNERQGSSDQPLLISGDLICCKWEETYQNYFFKEYASWNLADFPEFIHPEYEATRKTASNKQTDLSLEDCLDEFTKEEQLGEDDPWYCPRCKKHQQATKNMQIWKAPDVLVVHLKRFSNSRILRDKIDAFIDFPLQGLSLENRVGERLAAKALLQEGYPLESLDLDINEPVIYDLFGVDEHIGGLGGGHYRAYARNHLDGEWYHFDDTHVTKCLASESVTRNAYLLFYRRRATRPLGGKTHYKIQEVQRLGANKDVLLPTPPDEDDVLVGDNKSITLPSDHIMSTHPEPWTPSLTLPLDSISASSSPPALEDGEPTPGLDSMYTDALDRSNLQFSMSSRLNMFHDRMGSPVSSSSNEAEDGGSDEDTSSPSVRKAILKPATFDQPTTDEIVNWDNVDAMVTEPETSSSREHRDYNRIRLRNGLPSPEPEDQEDA